MLKISAVMAGMLCVTRQGKKEVSVSPRVRASWHIACNRDRQGHHLCQLVCVCQLACCVCCM